MTDDEKYLRDLLACFAMHGYMSGKKMFNDRGLAVASYELADMMLKVRNEKEPVGGITAVKLNEKEK
jgi:hypothetical protein